MPIRLALISFSCLSVFGCTTNSLIKSTSNIDFSKKLMPSTEKIVALNQEASSDVNNLKNQKNLDNNNFGQEIPSPNILTAPIKGSYMVLVPKGQKNQLGNPIYSLQLYDADGKFYKEFNTVTGRANTQDKNRDLAGTEAPLPNGTYTVAKQAIPAAIPEAGKRFLPIQPSSFSTGRTSLGIHYDPSYEKANSEDGTSGCIGLTKEEDFRQVLKYVRDYQPRYLEVKI